jgi:hypothetical protein
LEVNMNMKSLILGSAAGLVAITGAQAADLPVKAKAVEYVKVCSLYGAGFWYIPGTDTCLKIGGYLRAETAIYSGGVYTNPSSSVSGADNRLSNRYFMRARQDLTVDTRTATEYGVVRTFFDATFSWTTGQFTGTNSGAGGTVYNTGAFLPTTATAGTGSTFPSVSTDAIAGGTLGVYHAFIQFAGFTMGRTVSQFDAPWVNYPGNNFDGLVGGGGTVTGVNQISYTAQFGNGVSLSVSAQDQALYFQAGQINVSGASLAGFQAGSYGANGTGGLWTPDFVAALRVDQAWGLFQLSAAAHNNHVGYYGATEFTGKPSDRWGYAVQAAMSIKNIPTGPGDTINIQGVYTDGASRYNFQSLSPVNYSIYGGTNVPGALQSIGIAQAPDTVYATGTSQQSVRTYGMRGAYTHNWDAFWNTSLYGAYAFADFGGNGRALVCGAITPLLNPGSTCNPNFSFSQIGLITRWTPVKNLTFSADVLYSYLDQRHTGTITTPVQAATAKPATIYQLKDQESVSLLLRAQRNF